MKGKSVYRTKLDTLNFLTPSPIVNKARCWTVGGTSAAVYSGSMFVLSQYWYKNFAKAPFHFFDDNNEWNQIDKVAHVYATYFIGRWSMNMWDWAGVKHKNSVWLGGLVGTMFLTNIEILDGFSAKWGASWGDLAANALGSGIVIAQEKLWEEQRFCIKLSCTC